MRRFLSCVNASYIICSASLAVRRSSGDEKLGVWEEHLIHTAHVKCLKESTFHKCGSREALDLQV